MFLFLAIFGRPLELTLAYEMKKDKNRKVPELVQTCVEFLQANGLEMEGIFRFVLHVLGLAECDIMPT